MGYVQTNDEVSAAVPPTTPPPPVSSDFLARLAEVAKEAALDAGCLQMARFGKDGHKILENPSHDLKLAMDRASEAAIGSVLQNAFSDHAILAEEGGLMGRPADFTWIIDPLDGTLNYFHGIPFFCTSVACYHTPTSRGSNASAASPAAMIQGQPLVGVVYAPYFDWLFSATAGGGAFFNGQPLHNNNRVELQDAIVSISYGSHDRVIQNMETVVATLVRRAKKLRMFGASALELVQLAKGSIASMVQLNIQPWDFAAAGLIVSESGARFEARPNEMNGWQVLAATQNLFEPIKSILDATLPQDFLLT